MEEKMPPKGDKEEKKELWVVNLVVVNEDQPPKKVFVKGEETLDLYAAIAKLLNEQEIIKKALLS